MKAASKQGVTLDHVVYAGPNLGAMIDELATLTSVRPSAGGVHEDLGTHNALLGLGARQYLELLAPVPGEEERSGFARVLASLAQPRLYMWAVRVSDVRAFASSRMRAGLALGEVVEMSRTAPGGSTQHWMLSMGGADVYGSVLPFAIEWTTPRHPSDGLETGCHMRALRAEHPEPARILAALEAMGHALRVAAAETPGLFLELDTPAGPVELH